MICYSVDPKVQYDNILLDDKEMWHERKKTGGTVKRQCCYNLIMTRRQSRKVGKHGLFFFIVFFSTPTK